MSGTFTVADNALIYHRRYETLRIEGWGENSLRIRATENRRFTPHDWALTEEVSHDARVFLETRPPPTAMRKPSPWWKTAISGRR